MVVLCASASKKANERCKLLRLSELISSGYCASTSSSWTLIDKASFSEITLIGDIKPSS